MTLDIRQPEFWKQDAVDHELRRVYDICAGCRRCLPLCPSFKVMFERLDVDAVDGDVEKLPAADVKEVVDLCYQCKLCYNHCPYTPPHRWRVDSPRLMLRARSSEARAKGVTLQDRFLGNTELVGRLGSLTRPDLELDERLRAPPSGHAGGGGHPQGPQASALPPRDLLEVVRPAAPPEPALAPRSRPPGSPKIALFTTCSVEYNDPGTGKAAVAVLEKNGVDVSLPAQRCCRMPYLDGGAVKRSQGASSRTM